MNRYSVIKYFGHFMQTWSVMAESENEAWERAEFDGNLEYQQMYKTAFKNEDKGYVINQSKKTIEDPPITEADFLKYLQEAEDLGMILTPLYSEKLHGLPFSAVKRKQYSDINFNEEEL